MSACVAYEEVMLWVEVDEFNEPSNETRLHMKQKQKRNTSATNS